MNKAFLTSETYIKTYSNLDDNTAGKYIHPALYDAQNIDLQQTIGTGLLNKLVDLVAEDKIDLEENEKYKYLIENYIQDFLLYGTLSNLSIILSYKLSNFGVNTTSDEQLNVPALKEIVYLKDYYKDKQNFFKARLQDYLVENRNLFPEISNCSWLFPNLYSSSSCPIWIGGLYSKNLIKKRCEK